MRAAGGVGWAPGGAVRRGLAGQGGSSRGKTVRAVAPQRDRRPPHAVPFQGIGWGGKSELQRAVRRVIPGQGDLKESGTENIPPPGVPVPVRRAVRVKRCGKSAPRPPQGGWQAKPRTEQDRIGRRSRAARPKPPGRLLDPASDGGARGMVAARRPSVRGRRRVQNSAYRPSAAFFSSFDPPRRGAGRTSSVVPRTAWTVTGWPRRISRPAAVVSERHSSPRTRT